MSTATAAPDSSTSRARPAPPELLAQLEEVRDPTDPAAEPLSLHSGWPLHPSHLLLQYRGPRGEAVPGQWFGLRTDPARADASRLARARRETERSRGGAGGAVLATGGVLLHHGGADRVLRPLPEIAATPGMALVDHLPERHAVLAAQSARRPVHVRIVRPERLRRLVEVARAMGDASWLAQPRLLTADPRTGVSTWTEVPGSTLRSLLGDPALPHAALAAGRAARALHATPPRSSSPAYGQVDEAGSLVRWVALLSAFSPARAARAAACLTPALRGLRREPSALGLVHCDLRDAQIVMLCGRRAGLLNPGSASVGEPALDIANLLVHLELRAMQERCSWAAADRAGAAFLEGYRAGPTALERVLDYAPAARLRLFCQYGFRPRWAAATDALRTRLLEPPPGLGR